MTRGQFFLEKLKTDKYDIKISFIGYQSVVMNSILLQPGARDLGEIALNVLSENLAEITVKSTKSPVTYKVDRKVIDAGSFPGADAAIDLLENVPSVQLDMEGNLTYRGDGTFKVYINGHPVANGVEKLRQLPASRIDKVEVITNPSAKYDAEGNAGIIQVILKKSRLEGYSINSNIKADTKGGYQGMFSIDQKSEKSGWYINGYWSKDVWSDYDQKTEQTIKDDDATYYTVSDINANHGQRNSNIELGFNYDLSDKDFIDFSGYINPLRTKQKNREVGSVTEYTTFANGETTDSTYQFNSNYTCNYQYVGGTFTYEHAFKKDRSHLLSAYIDYSGYVSDLDEQQIDKQVYDTYTVREGFKGTEHQETMIEGKLNYKLPVTENISFETGAEINTDHIPRITHVSGTFDAEDNITKYDDAPSNQKVDFIQDVYSVYTTMEREGEKLSVQAGARVEFTNRRSDYSYDTDDNTTVIEPDRNKFTDFFPSAHITYNFTETHQVHVSYSRRIQRPNYWNLIPLEQYESSYSYFIGNGDLLPSYTNAFELGYSKSWDKDFISAEIFARNTKNVTQTYSSTYIGNKLMSTPENVGNSWSVGAEFMSGVDIFPWWNSNVSISLYSYRLHVDFDDTDEIKKQFKTDTRWNNTFLLPKDFTLKWDVKYNSPYKNAQTTRDGYWYSNLALKKSFKDGKWTVTAVCNDVFSGRKYDTIKSGDGFSIKTHTDNKSFLSLKLAYVFDNQK
jgi:outer membrane receptor protein involved in Fe transport